MRCYQIVFWLALFLISNHGIAQRFQSLNNEFPFANTRIVYQDEFGFLWFGTEDGLVKYNGYSAKKFRKRPGDSNSLPGTQVRSILQVSDSTLLLGFLNHGLAEFNRNTEKSRIIPIDVKDEIFHVYSLVKDPSGNIWIGTNQGLYKLEENKISRHYTHPEKSNSLNSNEVMALYVDKKQNLWVGTKKGIHLLKNDGQIIDGPMSNPGFPDKEVMTIQENSSGELFVSFRHGDCKIYKWNSSNMSFDPINRFKRDGEFSFGFDSDDEIWASSHGRGVYHFTDNDETFYGEDHYKWHGLRAMFSFSIYHDLFHNIWVESDELYKMPGSHKQFHSISSDEFQVISVYADENEIWYCSDEPYRWSREQKKSIPYLEGIDFTELVNPERERKHKRIYQYKEWDDYLVFTSIRNVYLWNKGENTFKEYSTKLTGAFREFIIDDNKIWIPGDNGNPAALNLKTGIVENYPQLSSMNTALAVVQDLNDVQWWGTRNHGLFSYDPKIEALKKFVPDPNNTAGSISSYNVNDLLVHSDGNIWIGTKFGLNRIDPITNQITQFNFEDQLVNTNINSILEDRDATLWLGTENGLINFDPISENIRHFTTEDGLINNNYSPRACYKDNNGCLYFGGDNGVDYFFPEDIGENQISPELYLGEIRVNGQVHNNFKAGELLDRLKLSHKENFIEIELVGLHYVAPKAQKYAYKLSRQSKDWISLDNNRIISLARLSPGKYILEAKCANPDGYWSEPKELLNFTIAPPFWASLWFLVLMSILILLTIYYIYIRRVKSIQNIEIQKTEFNKHIAEIEMKALRAQMNPHFLFNSLNSIRLMVDKGDNEKAKRYLTKYSKLIRQILNNSQSKFIRLEHEIQLLKLYLELEEMRFKNFKYSFSIDENVEADFLEIPPLLMQPYVENAIWHGLMHKETGERCLDIRIKKEEEFVIIEIEDNGIGRKRSMSINLDSKKNKQSLGLKISEERMNLLKDIYGKGVKVEIIDLENPTGTKVVIRIPLSD